MFPSNQRELCSECKIILEECVCDTQDEMPKECLFKHYYHNLTEYTVPDEIRIKRTYEGYANYYIVFAPLQNHVDSPDDLKKIEKYIRSKYQYERTVITKEILETRIHYNVFLTTKRNPVLQNGTIAMKYYLNVQHIPNQDHLKRVLNYMFKESKRRPFNPNRDYFIYAKK